MSTRPAIIANGPTLFFSPSPSLPFFLSFSFSFSLSLLVQFGKTPKKANQKYGGKKERRRKKEKVKRSKPDRQYPLRHFNIFSFHYGWTLKANLKDGEEERKNCAESAIVLSFFSFSLSIA